METIAQSSVLLIECITCNYCCIAWCGINCCIAIIPIYYIWHTAENDWCTGDFSDFKSPWSLLDTELITPQDNQPSVSTEKYNPQSPAE